MLEDIVQYHVDKGEIHGRHAHELFTFAAQVEADTAYTKGKIKEFLEKINYQTVQRNKDGFLPWLEFGHGMDDYGLMLFWEFGLEGKLTTEIGDFIMVRGSYELGTPTRSQKDKSEKQRNAIKIDTQQFPISQLGYSSCYCTEMALFYTWLAYWWQEMGGHECGLKVFTRENNSNHQFSLNDFLQAPYSAYLGDTNELVKFKVENVFPRNLTVAEIYLRASQPSYPFNPYANYWRYFEKHDCFKEIVTYDLATGIRQGSLPETQSVEVTDVIHHANPETAMGYLTKLVNQMTYDGWEEKFRPAELPEQMHETAFDFGYWSGIAPGWFNKSEKPYRLSLKDVLKFELAQNIKLPDAYAHYLRIFNGRQYNTRQMHFPIDDVNTIEVEQFYTLDELYKSAVALNKDPDILWIGTLVDSDTIGVCINANDDNYGKVVLGGKANNIICDYSFEKFAKYAQGHPVSPDVFAAENNDVDYFKKRLAEGWEINETADKHQLPLIHKAAGFNAHAVLKLLLENGAKVAKRDEKSYPYPTYYDERTLELLRKYD